MARPEDPIISEVVRRYAEMFTEFERARDIIKQAVEKLDVKSHNFNEAKTGLDQSLREGSVLLANLKDAIDLMHETATTEAARAAQLTMQETEIAIRKVATEASRQGFTIGAEKAIENAMGKSFGGLKEEIASINDLLFRFRAERKKLAASILLVRLANHGTVLLIVVLFLTAVSIGFWMLFGGPAARAIASDTEKAREYDLVWQCADVATREKFSEAYQEGVRRLAARAEAAAHQADLDAAAQESRRLAEEAGRKADQAEYEAITRANQLQTVKDEVRSIKAAQDYRNTPVPVPRQSN